ncbi:MAG: hypothetical protein KDK97_08600 [Verrucomicrobiales bacterium]|nr:hypothetical protein [Verrucomicrobiales bacterium]MCP5556203.1 hypothetical protein [Verrucomicrobiaceae bacterium]
MSLRTRIAKEYQKCFVISAVMQVFFLGFASLTFDGGQLSRLVIVSVVVYCLMAGFVVARHPFNPSHGDLMVVRSGFIVVFAAVLGIHAVSTVFSA